MLRERAEDQARLLLHHAIGLSLDKLDFDGNVSRVAVVGPWSWLLQFAPGRKGNFELRRPPELRTQGLSGSWPQQVTSAASPEAGFVRLTQPQQQSCDAGCGLNGDREEHGVSTETDADPSCLQEEAEAEEKESGCASFNPPIAERNTANAPVVVPIQETVIHSRQHSEQSSPLRSAAHGDPADVAEVPSRHSCHELALADEHDFLDDDDDWDDEPVGCGADSAADGASSDGTRGKGSAAATGDALDKATDYITFQHQRLMLQAKRLEERRHLESQLAEGLDALVHMPSPPHLYDLTGVWAILVEESDDLGPLMELFGLSRDAQHLCRRLDLQVGGWVGH